MLMQNPMARRACIDGREFRAFDRFSFAKKT